MINNASIYNVHTLNTGTARMFCLPEVTFLSYPNLGAVTELNLTASQCKSMCQERTGVFQSLV